MTWQQSTPLWYDHSNNSKYNNDNKDWFTYIHMYIITFYLHRLVTRQERFRGYWGFRMQTFLVLVFMLKYLGKNWSGLQISCLNWRVFVGEKQENNYVTVTKPIYWQYLQYSITIHYRGIYHYMYIYVYYTKSYCTNYCNWHQTTRTRQVGGGCCSRNTIAL